MRNTQGQVLDSIFGRSRRQILYVRAWRERAMNWPSIAEVTARAPLPNGYRYQMLQRQQAPELICSIEAWYPDIAVGNASCDLREASRNKVARAQRAS